MGNNGYSKNSMIIYVVKGGKIIEKEILVPRRVLDSKDEKVST